MLRIVGVLMLAYCTGTAYAQMVTVIDDRSSQPIHHVALYNQAKSISTLTDPSGRADISRFLSGDSIYFQHPTYETIGFTKEELALGDAWIRLVERNIMMDEFVVSAVRDPEKQRESAYMINVLGAEELELSNYQTGADVLHSTGTVMVQKSQGGGGSPILRGFEANKILLVVDGVRMNNAIYRSGHLQNAITIDNNILERVEVLFGPSSIMYGSDALGGVIHYYTRNPALEKLSFQGYTQYATANQGKIVHADMNLGSERLANLSSLTISDFGDIRAGRNRKDSYGNWGLVQHYAGWVNGRDSTLNNKHTHIQKRTAYRQYDFVNKTRFSPSTLLDLHLNLQLSASSEVDRFDQLNDYEGVNMKYAEWHYGPQNRFLASAQAILRNQNRFYNTLTTTLSFQRIDEDRITRRFARDERLRQEEDVYVYGATIDLIKNGEKRQKLYYGIDFQHNVIGSAARYENKLNGVLNTAPSRYPNGGSFTHSFSLYGNYKWSPGPKTILSAGARAHYGMLRSVFDDNNLPFDQINISNGALTGSISLVYAPVKTWKYNFILSTGFRNPNVDDYGKIRAKGDFVTIPNESIRSEYSYNAEMGLQKELSGIATFTGSVYFTYLTNAIVRKSGILNGSDSLFYDGDYYRIITNTNAGLATIQGLTLQASSAWRSSFQLKATLNMVKGRDISNDVPLGHIPPVFGRITLNHIFQKFFNEAYVSYSGRKYWDDMSPYGEDNEEEALSGVGYPSWYTLNLRSRYRLNDQIDLQISIENILDRFYKSFASGIAAPGRSFIFSLRAKF